MEFPHSKGAILLICGTTWTNMRSSHTHKTHYFCNKFEEFLRPVQPWLYWTYMSILAGIWRKRWQIIIEMYLYLYFVNYIGMSSREGKNYKTIKWVSEFASAIVIVGTQSVKAHNAYWLCCVHHVPTSFFLFRSTLVSDRHRDTRIEDVPLSDCA